MGAPSIFAAPERRAVAPGGRVRSWQAIVLPAADDLPLSEPAIDDAPAPLLAMPPELVPRVVRRVPPPAVVVAEPIFEPVLRVVETSAAPMSAAPDPTDGALMVILLAPLQPGETTMVGYLRKEHELRAVFASLSVPAARLLHARLSAGKADDALGAAFARMTLDRRTRLLVFLADARRREALSTVRR